MDRTIVIISDDRGETLHKLALTDDQINLLNWLREHDYVYEDDYIFSVVSDEEPPMVI